MKLTSWHRKQIRERLTYNPNTGSMRWIKNNPRHPRLLGQEAGTKAPDGRIVVRIFGRGLKRSRLAFILMRRRLPTIVDHIDGNPSNDRWENLRRADHSTNQFNQMPFGLRQLPSGNWQARIAAFGKTHYVGSFRSLEIAIFEHQKAKKEIHGKYARK